MLAGEANTGMKQSEFESMRFRTMIDNIILTSDNDEELVNAIKRIDINSRIKGITFYDELNDYLNKKYGEWLNDKKDA